MTFASVRDLQDPTEILGAILSMEKNPARSQLRLSLRRLLKDNRESVETRNRIKDNFTYCINANSMIVTWKEQSKNSMLSSIFI